MKIRIFYEDTDSTGVVYHANYIKFCDRARSSFFFDANLPIEDKGALLVHSLDCGYYSPARLGDIIDVKTTISEIKKASIRLKQEIFLNKRVIFELNIKLVYVIDGKPSKFPEYMTELFEKI